MYKFPRTPHLEGSRLQDGDEGMGDVPFSQIAGRHLVVEEKLDGANAGISFSPEGELFLQSRGHYLTGGGRERHFNLFKQWASAHQRDLLEVLRNRFVLYGEWLYAKHTVFYDQLPHYFVEFDIFDTQRNEFLSTERRRAMLEGLPIVSAPVLSEGPLKNLDALVSLLGLSESKSANWRERLRALSGELGLDAERVEKETDRSDQMEGLYIKVEEGGIVTERYKYVRHSFSNAILDAGTHWLQRPIVPNQLREGVDLFSA
jgi:hypothetical protein